MIDEASQIENVIIIGGGPAGLAAAIYNARANLSPLVFAGSPPGGQLTLTSEVENYPGFESILGPELIEKMRTQAKKFGAEIVDENVVRVDFSTRPFKVYVPDGSLEILSRLNSLSFRTPDYSMSNKKTDRLLPPQDQLEQKVSKNFNSPSSKNAIYAKSILIATGAKALWLGLPSETRLRGKGVSACATCDGFFFKGKTVAVVGGGDTAMEEALALTKFAEKVYIIHRRNEFRASKIMQERVLKHPKIEIIWNAVVEEIMGENRVKGIKLKRLNPKSQTLNSKQIQNSKDQNSKRFEHLNLEHSNLFRVSDLEFRILPVDGVFIAIGHKPDTDIFKGQIEMDEKGYIITNPKSKIQNPKFRYMTSIEGVFAAGDCVDHVYRQAATAVGMGVAAALDIERYLEA